ncbi:hypothetical protein [Fodinibius sp. Rm-B-1B1-1]|uniref:hypothetical protein n=1 Tax=Fodinibius alkaliphilus TaxID=3140241 RepID=UPI00315A1EAA
MQISGKYSVTVDTPMGVQEGSLILKAENGALSGTLTNPKGSFSFSNGTVQGNEIAFTTKIKTPMGRFKAKVSGIIEDDTFEGTAKLPLGSADIKGTRTN